MRVGFVALTELPKSQASASRRSASRSPSAAVRPSAPVRSRLAAGHGDARRTAPLQQQLPGQRRPATLGPLIMARHSTPTFLHIVYEPAAALQPEALRRVYDRLFETTAARLTGTPGPPPLPGRGRAELDPASLLSYGAGTMNSFPRPNSSASADRTPEPPSSSRVRPADPEEE
jgi:hypothetical protein